MYALQTPSAEHEAFDELCRQLDEFGPLPEKIAPLPEAPENDGEDAAFENQILAGLVSPV